MRVWGRMNITLVPIIALLLALAMEHLIRVTTQRIGEACPRPERSSLAMSLFIAAALVILSLQAGLYHYRAFDEYWETYFKHSSAPRLIKNFDERIFLATTVLATLGIVLFVAIGQRSSAAKVTRALVAHSASRHCFAPAPVMRMPSSVFPNDPVSYAWRPLPVQPEESPRSK